MHVFTVILAIVTVLGCPFGCLAGSGSHDGSTTAAVACCGHCCHQPLQQNERDHQPDGGPGKTCLCRGAILGQMAVDLDPLGETLFVCPAVVPATESPATALVLDTRDATCVRPYGDNLRIAIRSLVR